MYICKHVSARARECICVCVFRSPETLKPVYTLHAKMEKSNREVWDILVHAGLYTVYVIGAVQIFYRF